MYPTYGQGALSRALTFLVLGLAISALVAQLRNPRSQQAGMGLIGLSWMLISQAPFSFVGVVPGNGRYWYFAACGSAIAICALLDGPAQSHKTIPARRRRSAEVTILSALLLLCGLYGAQLKRVTVLYGEAGYAARDLQADLVAMESSDRLFVVDAPRFLHLDGVPAAQVFHWGLADSAMPPFSSRAGLTVYPLPPLGDRALSMLAGAGVGRVLRRQGGDLEPVEADPSILEIAFDLTVDGPYQATAQLQDPRPSSYRLVVVTQGSYHVEELSIAPGRQLNIQLPTRLIESMARLYPLPGGEASPVFWWLEQRRTDSGELLALSRPSIH